MTHSFGSLLRHERERRTITLASIAESTKISIALLEGLERDDVKRWPSGIFRKAYVKSYAAAIGLDPEAICREFMERYPDPLDCMPEPIPEPAPAPPAKPSLRERLPKLDLAWPQMRVKSAAPPVAVKVTIVAPPAAFRRGTFLTAMRTRVAAAACDLGMSCALALLLFLVLGKFWTPLGVSMLCYYAGGIVILGNTPGVCMFAPNVREQRPVT
jgi:transcriptional regulator with XRE-family HTH domain